MHVLDDIEIVPVLLAISVIISTERCSGALNVIRLRDVAGDVERLRLAILARSIAC